MEFKGTKGNWVVKEMDDTFIENNEGKSILCIQHNGCYDYKEMPYNAKLIASAPDLLEALQEVMRVYNEKGQLLSFNVDIARKAIEKALL